MCYNNMAVYFHFAEIIYRRSIWIIKTFLRLLALNVMKKFLPQKNRNFGIAVTAAKKLTLTRTTAMRLIVITKYRKIRKKVLTKRLPL